MASIAALPPLEATVNSPGSPAQKNLTKPPDEPSKTGGERV